MFGLRREAQVRRDAATTMLGVLQAEVRKAAALRQQLGIAMAAADTPSDCTALVERMMAKVPKSQMGRFAGRRLPSLTGLGLALEALYFGIDDLGAKPTDQRLIVYSLMSLLAAAAHRRDQLNDADYEMLYVIAESCDRHPRVVELLAPPAKRSAA